MNIIIEDIEKGTSIKGTYVATFPSLDHPPFTKYNYPVETDPTNAEQVLHILNAMCYHPEIYKYIKAHIPSPFLPDNRVRNRHIPLKPLLNYLAGPSKLHCLKWHEDNIEYSKSSRGLAVKHYSKGYVFSYANSFTNSFIEIFGESQWEDTFYKQALTDWDFFHADLNVAASLSPFETWFVSSQVYDRLCLDLQSICFRLEALMDQSFFTWKEQENKNIFLVDIMKEKSAFSY